MKQLKDINELLKIDSISDNTAQTYFNFISGIDLFAKDPENQLNNLFTANALLLGGNIEVKSNFKKQVQEKHKTKIFDFSSNSLIPETKNLKNYVQEKTRGNITDIPEINPQTKLAVLNIIYFSGKWKSEFNKKNTNQKEFITISNAKKELDFMNINSSYNYYENNTYQCLEIPYKNDEFSMLVILPKDNFGIKKVEEELSFSFLEKFEGLKKLTDVDLSLPKFEIESNIDTNALIKKLGCAIIFSDLADFSGISEDLLKVDRITHQTRIKIDEKKTVSTAASLTEMIVVGYGNKGNSKKHPVLFNADHSFLFMIKENKWNTILFMGRYVK